MSRLIPLHVPAWLIGGGILLTWLAAVFVAPDGTSIWQLGLLSAFGVGVPNACLVWFFRLQARLVRETAIAEVREMMADQVKNQLAVIGMCAPLTQGGDSSALALEGINLSVNEISQVVDGLSSDSLGSWQQHYHGALTSKAFMGP